MIIRFSVQIVEHPFRQVEERERDREVQSDGGSMREGQVGVHDS